MKIEVKTLRQIVKVKFPKDLDYHKLAAAAGVHDQLAWNWLKNGKVAERYIPILLKIPVETVQKEKHNGADKPDRSRNHLSRVSRN
jgi:hypothetical protein